MAAFNNRVPTHPNPFDAILIHLTCFFLKIVVMAEPVSLEWPIKLAELVLHAIVRMQYRMASNMVSLS